MFLAANPDRVKAPTEKEEIARRYKPGDSVFPKVVSWHRTPDESDEDERRLLEEVRELSLSESSNRDGAQTHRASSLSGSRHTDRVDNGRRDDGRSRHLEEERRTRRQTSQGQESTERARRIEHQSSLRSLLSLSDVEVMEEEILRQIMEEGLLDGIDLNNLGPTQEEELSERIAEAYRRRHGRRSRSQQRRQMRERAQESRSHARTQSAQRFPATTLAPETPESQPASRPRLLDPFGSNSDPSIRPRRLSDQGARRRRTSPVHANQASSSDDMLRPAARSSSDMTTERSRTSTAGRRLPDELTTSRTRRATESDRDISNTSTRGQAAHRDNGTPTTESPTSIASPLTNTRHLSLAREQHPQGLTDSSVSTLVPAPLNPSSRSRPSSSRSNASQFSALYAEPSVTCDRCGKPNIQYNLHKSCLRCKDGNFNLCMRCYRSGRGCLRWSGFGPSAQVYFEKVLASNNAHPTEADEPDLPHILVSLRYIQPPESARRSMNNDKLMTSDDPAHRLRTGFFCDICRSPANDCFWKCNQCNEGDWGFCNRCVNQGRCCTHALLPICRILQTDGSSASPTPTNAANDTTTVISTSAANENESFKILSFSTKCDICTYPIPASTTRFHCLECNHGDYDICANCYFKLVATSKISKENGHNGWRRCPKNHRMVVVGFEDHDEGQRRVIVRDLVGGRALKDEHLAQQSASSTSPSPEIGSGDWSWKEGAERRKKASRVRVASSLGNQTANSAESPPTSPVSSSPLPRFPPDGGVGLIVHALWSWYPEDDVMDELFFPRGAEITEGENINDDWFWGCYAGRTGLFPGTHVTVVGEVG